jgi:hypothetical protein
VTEVQLRGDRVGDGDTAHAGPLGGRDAVR